MQIGKEDGRRRIREEAKNGIGVPRKKGFFGLAAETCEQLSYELH